jgi:hypothetical protein
MIFEDHSGPESLIVAERIFLALSALDHLADTAPEQLETSERIGIGELYRHVRDPDASVPPGLLKALDEDVQLRADFARLAAKNALCRFPVAAAASSGVVANRECAGFRITLRKSRAESNQVYIIIDLSTHDDAPPSHLFVLGEEIRYCKHRLPTPLDGTIQILAEDGSDIVRALEDCHSEVFLR